MKCLKLTFFTYLFFTAISLAQIREIILEDIWHNTIKSERLGVLYPMNNGEQYTVFNNIFLRYTFIDIYDYKTLKKVTTLVNSFSLGLNSFSKYMFSDDETNVHLQNSMPLAESLIQTDKQFDFVIYLDINHSIYISNTRLHLNRKMTKFINENLAIS